MSESLESLKKKKSFKENKRKFNIELNINTRIKTWKTLATNEINRFTKTDLACGMKTKCGDMRMGQTWLADALIPPLTLPYRAHNSNSPWEKVI